jgi:hypothetical protein
MTCAYLWPDRVAKDPNFTCAILTDVLSKIDTTADVLYVQLDGAGGANKNRHVFEFCAALVQRGVFKSGSHSCRLATRMRTLLSSSVVSLLQSDTRASLITGANSPSPIVFTRLPPIPDLKAWFKPVTYTSWDQISKYRCYKFELHPDGHVLLFRKVLVSNKLDQTVSALTKWLPTFG